jgi:hypothetical protein
MSNVRPNLLLVRHRRRSEDLREATATPYEAVATGRHQSRGPQPLLSASGCPQVCRENLRSSPDARPSVLGKNRRTDFSVPKDLDLFTLGVVSDARQPDRGKSRLRVVDCPRARAARAPRRNPLALPLLSRDTLGEPEPIIQHRLKFTRF